MVQVKALVRASVIGAAETNTTLLHQQQLSTVHLEKVRELRSCGAVF